MERHPFKVTYRPGITLDLFDHVDDPKSLVVVAAADLAAAEARAEKAEGEVRYLRERRKWEVATLSPSSPLSVSCQAAVVAGQEGDCASCRGWLAANPEPQPPEGVAP